MFCAAKTNVVRLLCNPRIMLFLHRGLDSQSLVDRPFHDAVASASPSLNESYRCFVGVLRYRWHMVYAIPPSPVQSPI